VAHLAGPRAIPAAAAGHATGRLSFAVDALNPMEGPFLDPVGGPLLLGRWVNNPTPRPIECRVFAQAWEIEGCCGEEEYTEGERVDLPGFVVGPGGRVDDVLKVPLGGLGGADAVQVGVEALEFDAEGRMAWRLQMGRLLRLR
jgi:hypothetical protein